MTNKRQSADEVDDYISAALTKRRLRQKEFKKDGWILLGKKETVEKVEPLGLCDDFPAHGVGMRDSKFEILKSW